MKTLNLLIDAIMLGAVGNLFFIAPNGYRYILVPDLELQTYQNSINYERSRKVK